MITRRRSVSLAFAALAGSFVAHSAAAALVVGDGCPYADLQSAIDDASGSNAFILVVAGYRGDPISTGKTLHITGGVNSCTDPTVVGTSSLEGIPGSIGAIVTLTGQARLDLQNFVITGGSNDGHNGGGISFKSDGDHGHIELHNVTIIGNRADKGGGIFFDGGTGADDLVLDRVQVQSNFANNGGGGIRIQGDTRLLLDAASLVFGNTANPDDASDGRGGGLQALDNSSADVQGQIVANSARYGGGVSIHDFATVKVTRGEISSNVATRSGGAVFIEPTTEGFGAAFASFASTLSFNQASNGGAIYSDTASNILDGFYGGFVTFDDSDACHLCSTKVTFNTTTQPGGASIVMQNNGSLTMRRMEARSNSADYFLQAFDKADVYAANDLIADNVGSSVATPMQAVIDFRGELAGDLNGITIADNVLAAGRGVFAGSTNALMLKGALIWQPGNPTLDASPSSTTFVDVLTQDGDSLHALPFDFLSNVHGLSDPVFADASTGDYHLTGASPAVDYALERALDVDLDANPRGVRLLRDTTFDVGAYELQQLDTDPPPIDDTIFLDDFDGDL